jgi:predicted alpha/beta superfamily hydrolase
MPKYLPMTATHVISSSHVGASFQIKVMQPAQWKGATERYPVVYLSDANELFDALKGISFILQASNRARPFILVGVGYESEQPQAGIILRGRDFTFSGCPERALERLLEATAEPWEGVLRPPSGEKGFDGAQAFQAFLAHELIPFIDEKYSTEVEQRAFFGHSLGAGFGAYTLFTRPELFRDYLLSSPTLSYQEESENGAPGESREFIEELARRFSAAGRSAAGTTLYLSAASQEEFDPLIANWRFTSSVYRLAALLEAQKISGLKVITEVFQGEEHTTVWPLAFIHGIRTVFGGSACRSDTSSG